MKELLTGILLFLCLASNGQGTKPVAVLVGDSVHTHVKTWNAFQAGWAATERELSICDSLSDEQGSVLIDRDSTVTSLRREKQSWDTTAEQYRNLALVIPKSTDGDRYWKPFLKGTVVGAGLAILGTAALKIIFSNKY